MLAVLYESLAEARPWLSFLHEMRRATNSMAAALILQPTSPNHPDLVFVDAETSTEDYLDKYRTLFWRSDPFVDLPLDRVLTLDEFVGGTAALRAGEFYRDHLTPADAPHIMGMDLSLSVGVAGRFRLSRNTAAGPFGDAEKRRCAEILPHLKKAAALFCRLAIAESERSLYVDMLERLRVGVIIVDPEGSILSRNKTAAATLAEADGLRCLGGKLAIESSAAARIVDTAVHQAIEAAWIGRPIPPRTIRVDRPSGRPPLGLVVKSMPAPYQLPAPVRRSAVVLVSDPRDIDGGEPQALAELWDLTPAESQLSIQLMRGLSLDEASGALGIRRNTARAQLRSIFCKTNVHRQSDLARLLHSSAVKLL